MPKYCYVILLIFLWGCHHPPNATPAENDINQVIEAIILQEHLPVSKNKMYVVDEQFPISAQLRKLKIMDVDVAPDTQPRPDAGKIYLYDLFDTQYFEENDRSYLMAQDSIIKSFTIAHSLQQKLNIITAAGQDSIHRSGKPTIYVDMSVPIFSTDQFYAFVRVTYNTSGPRGGTTGFFLKKINDKWLVVAQQ